MDTPQPPVEALVLAVRASSTKFRIRELEILRDKLKHQQISKDESNTILIQLFSTYPAYRDRPSRKTVQACLRALFDEFPYLLGEFLRQLNSESSRSGLAPTSVLVLLEWCSLAIQRCSSDEPLWDKHKGELVGMTARLLELQMAQKARSSIRKAALSVIRRALRKLFQSYKFGAKALHAIVYQMTEKNSLGSKAAVLLGLIVGVVVRLTPPNARATVNGDARDSIQDTLVSLKKLYYGFWTREIIGSKIAVPTHIATSFDQFFANLATLDEIATEITPSIEKALLRAPEVVLNDLIKPMIIACPREFDFAGLLADRLVKPLSSNLKSTNAMIRSGATYVLCLLFERSHNDDKIQILIKEFLTPLTAFKIPSTELRVLHCQILGSVIPSSQRSSSICEGLATMLAKEQTETAAQAAALATSRHFPTMLLQDVEDSGKVTQIFVKGVEDKRSQYQRFWLLRIGDILLACQDSLSSIAAPVAQFVDKITPKLINIYAETTKNPIVASQNGTVVAAYVLLYFRQYITDQLTAPSTKETFSKFDLLRDTFPSDPKQSLLLNPKAYGKAVDFEDSLWLIRALFACVNWTISSKVDASTAEAWTQACLFTIMRTTSYPKLRKEAAMRLQSAYLANREVISGLIVRGLWRWFRHFELGLKDSAALSAQTGVAYAHIVVDAIIPQNSLGPVEAEKEEMHDQLLSMLVLCRSQILPKTNWIELCLKCGIDPGSLISKNPKKAMFHINQTLEEGVELGPPSESITRAACAAFADLAFVAPAAVTPLLIDQIRNDMDADVFGEFSPNDFAIARTPEGTTYVDVLSTKGFSETATKGRHDYDMLKWEEELRAQIAAKKGQQRKLTADERSKVEAQLSKEAKIRTQVASLEKNVRRGVGVVHALATGPPTQAESWLEPSISALLNLIHSGVALLVGKDASKAYLACANLLGPRLGSLTVFIGVATIRAVGAGSSLEDTIQEEPLGEQVTRVLYRLRLAGEQRPFDIISLTYILPLVCLVLERGGIGYDSKESADEQVTLALEFLASHSDVFGNASLPKARVIAVLIKAMQQFTLHYKLIKDCISDICRASASSMTAAETEALMQGAIVPQIPIRSAVLQATREFVDLTELEFSSEIWLACHEDDADNRALAIAIWQENALEVTTNDIPEILPYLDNDDKALRRATARAVAATVELDKSVFADILERLKRRYEVLAQPPKPERDAYGMVKKTDLIDQWQGRSGVALAFKELSEAWPSDTLVDFIRFLIDSDALGDRNSSVRDDMIDAAVVLITTHGSKKLEDLMKMFEQPLETSGKDTGFSDLVNEAIVILYGALAQHLKPGDSRIPKVVKRLFLTLGTPSETVQYAVCKCLPPLVRSSTTHVSEYIKELLDDLVNSPNYAKRRGAAYGLAGVVSGKGLVSLKENRIMVFLKAAAENKKESKHRQGAQFAFELLSQILGRTFEPYVIQIVPLLISGFGDASADVREACLDASKACFANLSSYGVKIILPILLEGLEEQQWRSKRGACELLGAMAYLDPQQLAQSLPNIIPPLTNVLNDSHKEVRNAANRSLQRFGDVISNPEIKSLVGILLKALSDPTKHTDEALDALIKVSFVHYLDAPSLALVVRILERGLGDRSATKKKAAQIIGSLAHLTDRKDIAPNLPVLVTGLRAAVIDPVPTTRATSSKALGSLVEKLGEDALPDLIPSLMATLRSDAGAADRLGSAQALSEVLAGLGTSRLEETLPTILQNVSSSKPAVREGFMSLFIFLPACFGNSFANYLNRIIPPILAGLADDVESIRETSLRAGRLLVKNFATKAIDLLLPELDRGLADNNHRIRLSSVELVGDLLFNLTGITGQPEQEQQDDGEGLGAAEAGHSLLQVLGEEKRNKILSSLYICRNDTSGLVRSAAIAVWKALVATPRTLKDLVPTLTQSLITRLASPNAEQRIIASNAFSELIKKAGEGVLATLLPTLEEGLQTSNADSKQGICIALREIITSSTIETLEDYEKTIISVVRAALVDSNDEVRETAAEAFDSMQQMFGKKAVDQVLPHLLNLLRTEKGADTALSALLTLLTDNARANIILPNLVPTLLTSPISTFNARAIASLAEVAGPAINRRLSTVLSALMDNMVSCKDADLKDELISSFNSIMLTLDESDGLNTAMSVIFSFMKHEDERRRSLAADQLAKFFARSELDLHRYNQDYIRVLLLAFDDRDIEVVKSAWSALSELMKRLRKEEMESLVSSTRQIVQQVGVAGHELPGFCLPKGINAILPIFLQGLMNGTIDQRTQSALAISDIIDRTSPDALKPFVTNITGPLIRVVSERSVDLKAAILLTLNNLLEKIPIFLKPFMPQLQRTFAKSLADPNSEILRSRAAKALGTLLMLKPRVDPLIAELITGSKTSDEGVRNAMLKALYEVVSKAGSTMNETSRNAILGLIDSDANEGSNQPMLITYARLFGALTKVLPPDDASTLVKQQVLTSKLTYASALLLNSILLECPEILLSHFEQETQSVICTGMVNKLPAVMDNSILAAGKFLLHKGDDIPFEQSRRIFEALAAVVPPGNPADARRLSLVVIRTASRRHQKMVRPQLSVLTPPVFASLRDMIIPVKLAAEAAFLAMFDVVESESVVFEKYMTSTGTELNATQKRSMQDYFKRVALRLANQARERIEAEGGQGGLGLGKDEIEDEAEIWSVGKVELGDVFSSD